MIEILEQITANGPGLIRSLFLWQQILGNDSEAALRLRRAMAPLVRLPLGAEVTPCVIPIVANPDGFNVQEAALPGADAVFAFVGTSGLRLTGTVDPTADGRGLRRLQVTDAQGKPYRRTGSERFMLRYRLPPQAVAARQLMFVGITQDPPGQPHLPQLQVWAELDLDGTRHFILPDDSRSGTLGADETIQLISFAPGALASHAAAAGAAFLSIEMTGDPIDVRLLGEALVIGG